MRTAAATPTIADRLRLEIRFGGSLRSLSLKTGITRANLMRFRRGDQCLSLDRAERLARACGYRLTLTPERSR
jgi:hypothetical protein